MDQAVLDNLAPGPRAGLIAMNSGKPLAHLTKETRPQFARDVLGRYLDGEDIPTIAQQFGVTPARLYQIIVEGDSEAWSKAQSAKALHEYQETLQAMKNAPSGLEFAQAREAHKSAQWTLEKLLRRLYGDDKTAINVNAAGQVSIQIVSYGAEQQSQCSTESSVIEGEKV